MSAITVRQAFSAEDVAFALDLSRREDWIMGEEDIELSHAAFPDGFFVGEVGGERVSHISAVSYGEDELCFVGLYVVMPQHRRRGYGMKTWDYAWERVAEKCRSISLTAQKEMVPSYERQGFKSVWIDYKWMCRAEKVVSSSPVSPECSSLTFTPFKGCNLNNLLKYDTRVFGYSREPFLRRLQAFPNSEGYVVSHPNGDIVGYCVLRKSFAKYGWYFGPWYANTTSIARALLSKAASFLMDQPDSASLPLLSCVIPGVNEKGLELARSINPENLTEYSVRMFAKSVPKGVEENSKHLVFGISSADVTG